MSSATKAASAKGRSKILQEEEAHNWIPNVDPEEREQRRYRPVPEELEELKQLGSLDKNLIKMQIRTTNQAVANVANILGGSIGKQDEKGFNKKAFDAATQVFKTAKKAKVAPNESVPLFMVVDMDHEKIKALPELHQKALRENLPLVTATINALKPLEDKRESVEKRMKEIVAAWSLWKDHLEPIKGLGELTFARIVANVGDFNDYDAPAKCWKRMGLAVMRDGYIQGRIPPGLSKEEQKQAWIERGYNKNRRSIMWVGTESLLKSNKDRYRRIFDRERERQLNEKDLSGPQAEITKEIRKKNPKISKKKLEERVQKALKARCKGRAHRYLSKRILKDIWMLWTGIAKDYTDIVRIEREMREKFDHPKGIDWDAA